MKREASCFVTSATSCRGLGLGRGEEVSVSAGRASSLRRMHVALLTHLVVREGLAGLHDANDGGLNEMLPLLLHALRDAWCLILASVAVAPCRAVFESYDGHLDAFELGLEARVGLEHVVQAHLLRRALTQEDLQLGRAQAQHVRLEVARVLHA